MFIQEQHVGYTKTISEIQASLSPAKKLHKTSIHKTLPRHKKKPPLHASLNKQAGLAAISPNQQSAADSCIISVLTNDCSA